MMPMISIDLNSLVGYIRSEIERLKPEQAEWQVALDGACDALMREGAPRGAVMVLLLRLGMTSFSREESDAVLDTLMRSRVAESIVRDWHGHTPQPQPERN